MTREIQKQTEIFYAENLSKIKGYNWIVEVPPNEVDWPDLLIKTSNDKFGLEVRDMYVDESRKGSIEKRDEIFREELLSELSRRYYEKNNVPIWLYIRGTFLKDHVEHILNYLLTAEFQEGITVHDITVNGNKTRLFVERRHSSFVDNSPWTYDTLGWVERIKDEDIEVIVKEKSFNINKYKKNIEKVSLLIVSNRRKNSGKLLLEKHKNINTYGFHKVFYYMHPLEAIVYESD